MAIVFEIVPERQVTLDFGSGEVLLDEETDTVNVHDPGVLVLIVEHHRFRPRRAVSFKFPDERDFHIWITEPNRDERAVGTDPIKVDLPGMYVLTIEDPVLMNGGYE
jgi:hypothetical protein